MRFPEEFLNELKSRVRLSDVIGKKVQLKKRGKDWVGLSPFTNEKTPSFYVHDDRGFYKCFSSQKGGDAITFLMETERLSFAEAVEKLAGRTGIALRYEEGGAGVNRQQGQRTRLVEAHKAAAGFYQEQLSTPEAQIGREFLTARGFDGEVSRHFGVGFAPKGWDALTAHLRKQGFTDAELLAGGLVSQGNRGVYDRFRGRLVWPIRDLGGDVVGFGARRLFDDDDGPKYLNTPETPIYKKSQVLYGIDLSRREISKQQQAVVVEGYTDCLAARQSGIDDVVAVLGTALGEKHAKLLRRYADRIVLVLDGDDAGRRRADEILDVLLAEPIDVRIARLPSGVDPCEFILERGRDAFESLLAAAGEFKAAPKGRIIVVGTSRWIANQFLGVTGNRDLFLNMLNWLSADEDLISIRPKDPEDRRLNMNARQVSMMFWGSVVFIPLLMLVAGFSVWWKRR